MYDPDNQRGLDSQQRMTYLSLWEPEPAPNQREKVGTRIEESGTKRSPSPPAGRPGLDHSRSDRIGKDTSQVVDESTEGDGLVPDSTTGDLGHDRVASRSDCNLWQLA
jgi:hypothetical protein